MSVDAVGNGVEKPDRVLTPKVILMVLVFVVGVPFLPLIISGQWDWWEGWVFAAVYILGFAISRALAARRHPDLLAERAKYTDHEDTKPWDRWLSVLTGLGGAAIPITAGLDALFGWSPGFSLAAEIAALIILLAGFAWGSYALIENRFFSGVVRIQLDRGHHVVSTGPYRLMRHPGYAGAMLSYLAAPIFLDSLWTFVPAVLLIVVLTVRTRLEDETLKAELPGYREYAERTRWRLVPGVW